MSLSSKNGAVIAGVFLVVLILRLPFAGAYPDGWDGADFILAIQKFDLSQQRPHFPGYPVYIALAKCFKGLGFSWHLSSLMPGLLSQGLSGGLLALFLVRITGLPPFLSASAVLLFLFHPMMSLWSLKIGTESLAGGALLLAFLCSLRGSFFLCGMALGLLMGVRLSYWPFIIAFTGLMVRGKAGRPALADFFKGVVVASGLWLVPLIAISGGPLFYMTAKKFILGHFFRWGGPVAATGDWSGGLRTFVWGLVTHVFAGPWTDLSAWRIIPGVLGSILAVFGFIRCRCKAVILWLSLPYALWVLLGQNLTHPRHLYPLALVFTGCVFLGLKELRRPAVFILLALSWAGASFFLCRDYHASVPPQVLLTRYVQDNFKDKDALLFCGQSYRMFDLYYPVLRRIKTGSFGNMEEWIREQPAGRRTVLFTSELQPLPNPPAPEAVFTRSRYMDCESPEIRLYRYRD